MQLIDFKPLKYNDTYEYPPWATALGWGLALSSIIQLPIYATYAMLTTPGSLKERWRILTVTSQSPIMLAAAAARPDGSSVALTNLQYA